MGKGREASDDQIKAFSHALKSVSPGPSELGRLIGESKQYTSQVRNGITEPPRSLVFNLERVLRQPPGSLSRYLGYLPAVYEVVGTDAAIMRDPLLTPDQRVQILTAYQAALSATEARA